MRTTTICLINQKGGCSKSSMTFHLAGYYASIGLKTLLLDSDPQGSLSQGFFGSTLVENLPREETLAAVFAEDSLFASSERLIVPTAFDGISIIRSNQTLAPFNTPEPEKGGLQQYALREFLTGVHGFDITLIDCPPNLYQCSWNSMVAADHVVVPFPPEDYGAQGLRVVHQAVENASALNPGLNLLGHVVTRVDHRLLVHRSYEQKLRSLYGRGVLETIVPEASAIKVAIACRTPITQYSPKSRAARLMAALGDEILSRTELKLPKRRIA